MIERRVITITEYGLYLMSPAKMSSFLTLEKNRSKKILNYFQKHHDKYILSLKEGVWIPILPIDSVSYIISEDTSDFNKDWKKIFEYTGFNLEVGEDNSIWVGSFGNLLIWKKDEFNKDKNVISYKTWDDEICNKAFRFEKQTGRYLVTISGFINNKVLNTHQPNRGFVFTTEKVENFIDYKDPREDDMYNFNKKI